MLEAAPPATMSMFQQGKLCRQMFMNRAEILRTERSSWLTHWQEIADFVFPRRFRYLSSDRNKGFKRNDKIINNTPTRAARDLGAGKMSGMTSPARPWFEFDTANMSDEEAVWTEEVEKAVYDAFARSNLYSKLHEGWETQGAFATAAWIVLEDDETDVRGHTFPIGQFMLAVNYKGDVDTCYREFSMTVAQCVREFGIKNCSPTVQAMHKSNQLDTWIEVTHAIEPNVDRDTGLVDNENMPFRSVWFERGAYTTEKGRSIYGEDYDGFLKVSGFEEFPVIDHRWYVTGEDVYGSGSPGMDCLGDAKALQMAERRKATAVDLAVKPPMKGPSSLRTQKLSLLPGDMNYVDDEGSKTKFEPAVQPPPNAVQHSLEVIHEHEFRINETFMVTLFRSMQAQDTAPNGGKQPITAREVAERHDEKMLQLGPVVEGDQASLMRLINRVGGILGRRGKLPPPPPSMRGKTVRVQFTSIMAQAQKLLGTAAKERAVGFMGSVSAIKPEVTDNLNWDKMMRNYMDALGMSADELVPMDQVMKTRQARAQQQAQQAQMQQLQTGADAAKVASQADLSGDNVLSRLLNTQGGQGGPIGS